MSAPAKNISLILTLTVVLLIHAPIVTAQKSIDGKQDIAELLATAEESFNLANEDAVILFDALKIRWLPDSRLVKEVHRIIWINTGVAVRRYGDHRIPYDDAHCTFNVVIVRTWRDGQWWQSGPTGIVETLPHALRTANDYANMREMMLLHDGIELPCILEIKYSIEDDEPFRGGHEGLWTFARRGPAVQSRFTLELPRGQSPNVFTPEVLHPEKSSNVESELDTYQWQMGPLAAIPRPHTEDPASHVSYITWSTWGNSDWMAFGGLLKDAFESAIRIDETLAECVDSLMEDARTDGEKAQRIAGFVNERTRFIDYPETYWWSDPRPATRTYKTAYGHRLDRAILAAAMFSRAGLKADPAFLSLGYENIDQGIPTLARMTGIGVWVSGDDLDAWYDPANSAISHGPAWAGYRSIWRLGIESRPQADRRDDGSKGRFEVRVDLSFDKEKEAFAGNGYINAEGCLSPYSRMAGLADETKSYLGRVASGVISGMKVTNFNPSVFSRSEVSIGCELELKKPEPDDFERLSLIIGQPAGGIFSHLPDDIRLFHQERLSPVYLPSPMSQRVEFRLATDGLEITYVPNENSISNEAGSFNLTVTSSEDRITVTREIDLSERLYEPDEWSALRALLLAANHEKNQTLLVKQTTDTNGDQKEKDTPQKE